MSAETGGILGAGLVLGALSGPAIMALIFVKLALNKKGQDDYWKRVFDYKRISGKWYLAIFLFIPVIGILSAIMSGYWESYSFANKTPSLLLTAIVVPLVPLLEELGWRGYVLDRLQENYGALSSSMILGVIWGFWHLPAFFLMGGGLSVIPFASLTFWEYMGGLTALSICMTWIYNNTNRSTLSAILFHAVLEFWADTGLIPWDSSHLAYHLAYHVGLWAIVAIGITAFYGVKHLAKKDMDKKILKPKRNFPKMDIINRDDNKNDLASDNHSTYTPFHSSRKKAPKLENPKDKKELGVKLTKMLA